MNAPAESVAERARRQADAVDNYRSAVLAAHTAAVMLAQYDVPALLDAIEHADSVGPLLDPTLWMKKRAAMEQDREILKAALPLWKLAKKLEQLRAERGRAEGGADG